MIVAVLVLAVVLVAGWYVSQGRRLARTDPLQETGSVIKRKAAPSNADSDERNGLISSIGNEIMNSSRVRNLDWKMVSIVFDLGENSVSNSGFAYLEDKIVPVVASGSAVGDYVRRLRDALELPGKAPFAQMLVQIRRDGKFHVDFEYDNPSRWRIGPANLDHMREVLRPQFED